MVQLPWYDHRQGRSECVYCQFTKCKFRSTRPFISKGSEWDLFGGYRKHGCKWYGLQRSRGPAPRPASAFRAAWPKYVPGSVELGYFRGYLHSAKTFYISNCASIFPQESAHETDPKHVSWTFISQLWMDSERRMESWTHFIPTFWKAQCRRQLSPESRPDAFRAWPRASSEWLSSSSFSRWVPPIETPCRVSMKADRSKPIFEVMVETCWNMFYDCFMVEMIPRWNWIAPFWSILNSKFWGKSWMTARKGGCNLLPWNLQVFFWPECWIWIKKMLWVMWNQLCFGTLWIVG